MKEQFILKKMITFHCKRGAWGGCERCIELKDEGEKYCILSLPEDIGMVSRPVVQINIGGEQVFFEYEFYRTFNTKEEALEASKGLNIIFTDID